MEHVGTAKQTMLTNKQTNGWTDRYMNRWTDRQLRRILQNLVVKCMLTTCW